MNSRPMWILAGQAGVVMGVIGGFSAIPDLRPRVLIALLCLAASAMVLLGPARRIEQMMVSMAVLAYLGWWAVSFLWTYQQWVFLRDTQYTFPLVAAFVAFATLLPYRSFTQGLVASVRLGLIWIVAFTVLNPAEAMSHDDGIAGWTGPFGHKNGLTMFLLFAVITTVSFETRRGVKLLVVVTSGGLILASQSVTAVVVALALLGFAWFFNQVISAPRDERGRLLAVGAVAGMGMALLALVHLPTLAGLAGRDPTMTRRTEIWDGVIEVVRQRPLTGYGIGGAWINHAVEPTRTILRDLGFFVYHSHNGFLEILLQLGLVGLFLFGVLAVAYSRSSLSMADTDPVWSRYTMLFIALVFVSSLSEVSTFGIYLALICGFHSLSLSRASQDEHRLPHLAESPQR
jgi:exopolysaccharide production protein ExoQ